MIQTSPTPDRPPPERNVFEEYVTSPAFAEVIDDLYAAAISKDVDIGKS